MRSLRIGAQSADRRRAPPTPSPLRPAGFGLNSRDPSEWPLARALPVRPAEDSTT